MTLAPSICGVILAAGFSTRMGRDKALLPWPPVAEGTPVAQHFSRRHHRSAPGLHRSGHRGRRHERGRHRTGRLRARRVSCRSIANPSADSSVPCRVGLQEVLNQRTRCGSDRADRPPAGAAHHACSILRDAFLNPGRERVGGGAGGAAWRGNWCTAIPSWLRREMIEAFLRAPDGRDRPRCRASVSAAHPVCAGAGRARRRKH